MDSEPRIYSLKTPEGICSVLGTYINLSSYLEGSETFFDAYLPFLGAIISRYSLKITGYIELKKLFMEAFHLIIPQPFLEMIATRAVEKGLLKESGTGYLTNMSLAKEIDFTRSVDAISLARKATFRGLRKHMEGETSLSNKDVANMIKLCLNHFDSSYLLSLPKGTSKDMDKRKLNLVLASYMTTVYAKELNTFRLWVKIIMGHMLTSFITYSPFILPSEDLLGLIIFLDTPILLKLIGFMGTDFQEFYLNLITDIQKLGGKVLVSTHIVSETTRLVEKSCLRAPSKENRRNTSGLRGTEVNKVNSGLLKEGDVFDLRGTLSGYKIQEVDYSYADVNHVNQIDEEKLRDFILKVYTQSRPDFNAKEYEDAIWNAIKSISLIQHLRGGVASDALKSERYVFITDNRLLALAGKMYEQAYLPKPGAVPCCLYDGVFANLVWMNKPNRLFTMNSNRITAVCIAAASATKCTF